MLMRGRKIAERERETGGASSVVARDYYFEKPNKRLEIVAMLNGTGTKEECEQNCRTLGKAYVYTMSYRKKRVVLVPVASNEKFDGSKIDVDLFTKKNKQGVCAAG